MSYNNEKIGAFIVPTGIGASIGGYAGDASKYARKFAQATKLIVNPNVVNAACFSGITPNMLYTEGYSLDQFFKGKINLIPSSNNKIGIIYDKAIPNEVLNIHINTQNAVATIYDIDIHAYEITEENVGVEFYLTESGISAGDVKNIRTLDKSCQKLLDKGCNAIAIVCLFEDAEDDNEEYSQGIGADPVGGVEAIISHYISKKFKVPCAHAPAFLDYTIYPNLVNPKASAEYITPTFLPCILLGLSQAPLITENRSSGINISNIDFLVMPYNSLGAIPVFEAIKRDIKTYAVKENSTELCISKETLFQNSKIIEIDTYESALKDILES
ncbi:DUF3326 domain-containing protein [bacterium]|nr:DUF3326 domain-containing protein [bacterium]